MSLSSDKAHEEVAARVTDDYEKDESFVVKVLHESRKRVQFHPPCMLGFLASEVGQSTYLPGKSGTVLFLRFEVLVLFVTCLCLQTLCSECGIIVSTAVQVWRNCPDDYANPISIWHPCAPDGFVSPGCIAVPSFEEPDSDLVYCVAESITEETVFEDQKIWSAPDSYPWACHIYQVKSDALHFVALRLPRADESS
ncbi:hypothetical protein RHMOL_Rhmol01G0215000 [Rhododendron molle]|uniref:Uncharacterized protein n=1 Tax=Rhododendron molle TaxID=49168 RepID=A0ACC0Q6M3_RHOML|nr:hypothetical protein RHMOL_Rhmol01G0215000 [Rhododendron molle]